VRARAPSAAGHDAALPAVSLGDWFCLPVDADDSPVYHWGLDFGGGTGRAGPFDILARLAWRLDYGLSRSLG
jgi:hypothetical protein